MTVFNEALAELTALAVPENATAMATYHKAPRIYLGVSVPDIETCVKKWKTDADIPERVALAHNLWESDIHEARLAATKLLIQARIPHDEVLVWEEFLYWVSQFDSWALADHACKVGERRLMFKPNRIDIVETWTTSTNKWVRRAALVATLPWSKERHLDADNMRTRERILGWAETYVADRDWFIQKSVAWWLRSLSLRDPERVQVFLSGPGQELKAFARKDAGRLLPKL